MNAAHPLASATLPCIRLNPVIRARVGGRRRGGSSLLQRAADARAVRVAAVSQGLPQCTHLSGTGRSDAPGCSASLRRHAGAASLCYPPALVGWSSMCKVWSGLGQVGPIIAQQLGQCSCGMCDLPEIIRCVMVAHLGDGAASDAVYKLLGLEWAHKGLHRACDSNGQ